MSWPLIKLECLAAEEDYSFVGGPFGSKLTTRDYVESGIPVIRGSNLGAGRYLSMDDFVFVTEDKVREDLRSNLAKPNDVIFTQRGTLGQVAIIPETGISNVYVVSQSQMKLTVSDAMASNLYIYYYFSSREGISRLVNFASSSGVPHINLGILRNFEIPVPPLPIQKRIADVLSKYDDLIENNRRRIALLEQAARELYREWFVRLRFPGHEHVEIIDGVPEGWSIKSLGEICILRAGDVFKPEFQGQSEGELPFIKVGDFNAPGNCLAITVANNWVSEAVCDSLRGKPLPNGTVVFAKIGEAIRQNRVRILTRSTLIDNNLMGAIPRDVTSAFLYCLLSNYDLASTASGAAVPFLSAGVLSAVRFLVPSPKLDLIFSEKVDTLLGQIKNLQCQSTQASRARDLLLPRLMNGSIAV